MYFITNFLTGVSKWIGFNTLILSNFEYADFQIYSGTNTHKSAHITAYTNANDHDTVLMLKNLTGENIKIINFNETIIDVPDGWKTLIKPGDIIILGDDSQFTIKQLTPPHNHNG